MDFQGILNHRASQHQPTSGRIHWEWKNTSPHCWLRLLCCCWSFCMNLTRSLMDEIHISMGEINFLLVKSPHVLLFQISSSFSSIKLLSTSCRAKPLTSATPPAVQGCHRKIGRVTKKKSVGWSRNASVSWLGQPSKRSKTQCVTLWVPAFYGVCFIQQLYHTVSYYIKMCVYWLAISYWILYNQQSLPSKLWLAAEETFSIFASACCSSSSRRLRREMAEILGEANIEAGVIFKKII